MLCFRQRDKFRPECSFLSARPFRRAGQLSYRFGQLSKNLWAVRMEYLCRFPGLIGQEIEPVHQAKLSWAAASTGEVWTASQVSF